jgi:hypothetical protein
VCASKPRFLTKFPTCSEFLLDRVVTCLPFLSGEVKFDQDAYDEMTCIQRLFMKGVLAYPNWAAGEHYADTIHNKFLHTVYTFLYCIICP